MHPLSKLVVCVVMLRGRHRALPVAIDRAIMLPHEFKKDEDSESTHDNSSTRCRPFTFSETMNSRYTGDLRQRVPGRSARMSSSHQGGYDMQQNTNEMFKGQHDSQSVQNDRDQ